MDRGHSESANAPLTTLKVRSAFAGDKEALQWIVLRFSPLLLVQARYRMRSRLRRYYAPEDVVADTWLRAIPKLADFRKDEGRNTPRLVKFLATIVTHRVNELLRQWTSSPLGGKRSVGSSSSATTSLESLSADPSADLLKGFVMRDEVMQVMATIEDLDPRDQEIFVLRKVEGWSSSDVAARLEMSVSAVDTRLSRCLTRLRARLRESVFDELCEDDVGM